MTRRVEIRSYRLQPGGGERLHQRMSEAAVPMLRRWGTDVVRHGQSLDGEDGYVLIRAYASHEDLHSRQDEFYGSDEWRDGPRAAILAQIQDYLSVVLALDEAAIDALRAETGIHDDLVTPHCASTPIDWSGNDRIHR